MTVLQCDLSSSLSDRRVTCGCCRSCTTCLAAEKTGVCCLPQLTRPDWLSCDVKLSPQCSLLLVTIISMNCLNVVSSMTAQGNAFHKLSVHQIHSAFRFTFATSEISSVLCWKMEEEPIIISGKGQALLVSFCSLQKLQRSQGYPRE